MKSTAARPAVQQELPYWRALLEVYSALAIPVVFSLLIGLNMITWARKRLNYVFIFELDLRTVIDPREYIEVDTFFFPRKVNEADHARVVFFRSRASCL